MRTEEAIRIQKALEDPFPPSAVRWKPIAASGDSHYLFAPYIDVRAVEDRLDAVLGIEGWQDEYTPLADKGMFCHLRIKIDGEWVTKVDVGDPGDSDEGDKSACSGALKRAAVKVGIGRYLYRLRTVKAPCQKFGKTIVPQGDIRLPAWALPGGSGHPPQREPQRQQQQAPQQAPPPPASPPSSNGPTQTKPTPTHGAGEAGSVVRTDFEKAIEAIPHAKTIRVLAGQRAWYLAENRKINSAEALKLDVLFIRRACELIACCPTQESIDDAQRLVSKSDALFSFTPEQLSQVTAAANAASENLKVKL